MSHKSKPQTEIYGPTYKDIPPESHWITRDGRVIAIARMSTEHLKATVVLLERQEFATAGEIYAALRYDGGEHATEAAHEWALEAKYSPSLSPLRTELARRLAYGPLTGLRHQGVKV